MQVIESLNKAAKILVPPAPHEVRINCNSDWACIVKGDTKGLSPMAAQKQGLILGTSASLVLVEINETLPLTMGQYYVDEVFTQVWAIPVEGDILQEFGTAEAIKEARAGKSILTHFLLRSISRDKLKGLQQEVAVKAFQKDRDPVVELMSVFDTTIFDMSFQVDAGPKGQYAYVTFVPREPKNDFERGALEAGGIIRDLKSAGMNYLSNPRIPLAGETQDESVAALPAATTPVSAIPAVPQNGKALAATK